jgi:hypothetical protein
MREAQGGRRGALEDRGTGQLGVGGSPTPMLLAALLSFAKAL